MDVVTNQDRLSLLTIKDGALVEQFNRALTQVVENLADINTTTKTREILLSVKITPNTDRTFLEIVGTIKAKLSGQEAIATTADLSFDDHGRAVAYRRRSRQQEIPFNVTKMKGETIQ